MKNIMLIAVATLTIATANATNWVGVLPMKIVNETNVVLGFKTYPANEFLTVNPGETKFVSKVGVGGTYLGSGIDSNTDVPAFLNLDFDKQPLIGAVSATDANITQISIFRGKVLSLGNVGDSDTLTIAGWARADGYMIMGVTRTRGVVVHRGWDINADSADVFCLDTNVEFGLRWNNTNGRCPAGETRVVMADNDDITTVPGRQLNDWDAAGLISTIHYNCTYQANCTINSNGGLPIRGMYMHGFNTVNYSNSSSQINLSI